MKIKNEDGVPISNEAAKAAAREEMCERVKQAFYNLVVIGEEMKAALHAIQVGIEFIEGALKGTAAVPAWVELARVGSSTPGKSIRGRFLGYTQVKDQVRLCIRKSPNDKPEDSVVYPFTEAPLWMQCEAIDKIPTLLEKIVLNTEEVARTAQGKAVILEVFVNALKSTER